MRGAHHFYWFKNRLQGELFLFFWQTSPPGRVFPGNLSPVGGVIGGVLITGYETPAAGLTIQSQLEDKRH